uniref:ABC transporter permease n=1 Tax=candidate division WOR-3 bacterium TaxID=2052148 RepID=A0A7C4X9K6_UNCW3
MNLFSHITDYTVFFLRSVILPWRLAKSKARIAEQVYNVGVGSLPIIFLISSFLGMVTTVQLSYQLLAYLPRYYIGAAIGRMVLIELGPVLTALTVCGRCASSMAAEVGTMRVTEQIDALEVMAIDPYHFLNFPRIIGTLIALPLLTVFSEFVAISVGGVYAHLFLNIPLSVFNYGLIRNFFPRDLFGGLLKSVLFSLVIANSGCYFGFNVKGGAKEVGQSTTYAVVTASILILLLDFIVALVIFG